jgi:hypothetical protein
MTAAPWREVTPDDFLRPTFRETSAAQKALLRARDEGRFRLRVVFYEAKHLKCGSQRDPLWLYDYHFGHPPHVLWGADEVVIETRDGRWHVVERDRPQEGVPFGHLHAPEKAWSRDRSFRGTR